VAGRRLRSHARDRTYPICACRRVGDILDGLRRNRFGAKVAVVPVFDNEPDTGFGWISVMGWAAPGLVTSCGRRGWLIFVGACTYKRSPTSARWAQQSRNRHPVR
jgi:hypothetical protein